MQPRGTDLEQIVQIWSGSQHVCKFPGFPEVQHRVDATGLKRQETWMLRGKTGMSGDLGAGNLNFLPMLTPGSACSMLFIVFNPDK